MPLNIRDPRVHELASKLARQKGTTMTAVIADALEKELKSEHENTPILERLKPALATDEELARVGGHRMTKDEIDRMWGHE